MLEVMERAIEELSGYALEGPDNPELTCEESIVQTFHLVGLYSRAMFYARHLTVTYNPIRGGVFH